MPKASDARAAAGQNPQRGPRGRALCVAAHAVCFCLVLQRAAWLSGDHTIAVRGETLCAACTGPGALLQLDIAPRRARRSTSALQGLGAGFGRVAPGATLIGHAVIENYYVTGPGEEK